MALLTLARLLIMLVRFDRWKVRLGPQVGDATGDGEAQWIDHHLARVVLRGAHRLPFHCACLPQAMALHWMLHRRDRSSDLVIAALPGPLRGSLNDLHAWAEKGGEVLIGETALPHQPLARFRLSHPR
jgi:Transglutaminase-like superfamily